MNLSRSSRANCFQGIARNIFHMTDLGEIFIESIKRASVGKMVNIPNLDIFGS